MPATRRRYRTLNTPPRLIGGGSPKGPADLLRRLDELGVEHETMDHDPVFTVEEALRLRGRIPGAHSKNFHPLDNSKTTTVSKAGLMRFLEAESHSPHIVRFPGAGAPPRG